jgi:hypothetical protein
MLARFVRYVEKVFAFSSFLPSLRDARREPVISTQTAFLASFVMFATGRRSLNALETELRLPKRLDALLGAERLSVDSLGRIVALMDPGPLRAMLSAIHHRLKRNKALLSQWPLRFVALDGHEFFRLAPSVLRGLRRADDPHQAGRRC